MKLPKNPGFTPLQILKQVYYNLTRLVEVKNFKNKSASKGKFVTGFTLVELLIVVAIIGVLATIMYPNFQGMITRARLKEIYSTIEVIKAAEKYYYFKKGAYYQFAYGATGPTVWGYPEAEAALNINLPKNTDFLRYDFTNGTPSGGINGNYAWAKAPNPSVFQNVYFYNLDNDTSYKNSSHQYAKYMVADQTL